MPISNSLKLKSTKDYNETEQLRKYYATLSETELYEELQKVERILSISKAKSDLKYFVEEVLHYKPLSSFHSDLIEFIQKEDNQKLVLVPRSHLKTTIVTIGYTLWRIVNNPNIRIFIANANLSNAKSFLREIKGHIENNPAFKNLFGNLANEKKWTEDTIIIGTRTKNIKEPTIQAAGVGATLVSQHYDLMIFDDLVNNENVATKDLIEKMILWYKLAISLKDSPQSQIIIIGTRYSFDDLYGWVLESEARKNYKVLIRKAIESGEPLWPEKFTIDDLENIKMEQGPSVFSNQYMNEPLDEETAIFKRSFFQYKDFDDLESPYRIYITADLAMSQKKTADYTVFLVNAVDKMKHWHVVEILRDRINGKDIIDAIFNLYEKWKGIVGIEDGKEWMALKPYFYDECRKRGIFPHIREISALKGKFSDSRIRGLEPLYRTKQIFHIRRCKNIDILEDELLKFTKSKFDDCADALAHQLFFARLAAKEDNDEDKWDKRKLKPAWLC